jgi:hypothetical protein
MKRKKEAAPNLFGHYLIPKLLKIEKRVIDTNMFDAREVSMGSVAMAPADRKYKRTPAVGGAKRRYWQATSARLRASTMAETRRTVLLRMNFPGFNDMMRSAC